MKSAIKNTFRHYLLLLFLFIVWETTAQTREVRFNLVSGTNGIKLGKIAGIAQDKYGFMWFADQTNQAIVRFDGHHMKMYQYNSKNPNALGGFSPECLATDSLGNIWIGFYGTGLDKFDPVAGTFTHYRHDPKDETSLINDVVSAVLVDHLGNVWVGTDGGLDLLDQRSGKFKHYIHKETDSTSLSHNVVRSLYEDKAGELWIGTGMFASPDNIGGLNHFHRNSETFTRYLSDPSNPNTLTDNRVKSIFEDSRGTFWIGTNGDGLHTLDRKTGLFKRLTFNPQQPDQLSRPPLSSPIDHITFITEDSDKKIWIGTWNGLTRYDPSSKQITRYGNADDKAKAFSENTSWCAYATPDGLIWLGTETALLFRIDIYNTIIPHVDTDGVRDFYEEGDSIGWYATETGLVRKDFRNGAIRKFQHDPANPNSLSNNVLIKIQKAKAGNLWIATASGLNHFNPKTEAFTRYYLHPGKGNSLDNFVQAINEESDSTIWVGMGASGLTLLNWKSGKSISYKNDLADNTTISYDAVSLLYKDEANDLWIACVNFKGLNKLNRSNIQFTRYLQGNGIGSIYQDASGIMWVGSSSGLYWYDKTSDKFSSIANENNENVMGGVFAITGDKENNLWMSTASGIYMLNKKRDQWYHYGKEYGVGEAERYFYNSSFVRQNGEILFGTTKGYYAFYPEKLKTTAGNANLYFTSFWLSNKEITPGPEMPLKEPLYQTREIQLNHDENVFSFGATYIDFRNANDNYIHFQLENFDSDWRIVSAEEKVQYYKVPPGEYTLRIKTPGNSDGEWIEKSISVIIAPPWWNTWQAYIFYSLVFMASVYSVHRFQRSRVIRAERERTRERELAQAKEIEKAYTELKTTQAQLIQSEKMASLGELTAGIAHEIQNPLNFVNNFSEVNEELLAEMRDELDKGNIEDAKAIANDAIENQQKILHHGKRADAIVKGMLQHSRSSSGVKESTDINALCDEYLRLAYHGLRAKDKTFNAKFETHFDPTLPKVNIVPQEIGRVILNLINNAFYAVNEKTQHETSDVKSQLSHVSPLTSHYEPMVRVSTKNLGDKIEISVKDNGNGIPEHIKEKIFQPFFTTKPTGQGTGLGLSLSYDIVKTHGGELMVESSEGNGSEFTVHLYTA
jgi:signal transduction histidine kinase/ligand-binding sensor domain-containing protein